MAAKEALSPISDSQPSVVTKSPKMDRLVLMASPFADIPRTPVPLPLEAVFLPVRPAESLQVSRLRTD